MANVLLCPSKNKTFQCVSCLLLVVRAKNSAPFPLRSCVHHHLCSSSVKGTICGFRECTRSQIQDLMLVRVKGSVTVAFDGRMKLNLNSSDWKEMRTLKRSLIYDRSSQCNVLGRRSFRLAKDGVLCRCFLRQQKCQAIWMLRSPNVLISV